MAYNEFLADRISNLFKSLSINFEEKKMFGGLCYMVDNKMCLGIMGDSLMARVGPEVYDTVLEHEECRLMEFTGRPLKGYVLVDEFAIDKETDLNYWVQLCLDYNPHAKASKKRNLK